MSIKVGQGVILKKGKNLRYVLVSPTKQEKMENFSFSCADMIGQPFGTAFKVVDKKRLQIIDPVDVEEHVEEYSTHSAVKEEETRDNRMIHDNPDSQKLTKEEIMSLREEGKSGEEIVHELVANSATFNERTEYSKAKYLKKKKKKYIAHFIALKPSARLISELYFKKNPGKILDIRPDSLAQILTWSNVQCNSNVLLMETCQGFIAGAIMERLGSSGKLLQLYQGSYPVRIILEQFNFCMEETQELLCSFPLDKVGQLQEMLKTQASDENLIGEIFGKGKSELNDNEKLVSVEIGKKNEYQENEVVENCHPSKDEGEKGVGDHVTEVTSTAETTRKRKRENESKDRVSFISKEQRIVECLNAMKLFRSGCFDTLVIVSKYHPKRLLLTLLEYLPCGCPFVVYFSYQEPLMDCYITLREQNIATNLEVTESWLRNIQVLPNRTHPEIVMSASGGYLLRGIKVRP